MSIRGTLPSGGAGGGVTLPIAESDVTNLTTDLAAKASALVASQSISGTATLVDGSAKMVLTDTTSAAFTLTLPAAPSSGSIFIIIDQLGTWNTNNLTVARNGKLIDGVAANATHVTQYGIVEYLYDGTGWRSKIRQLSQANPVIDGTAAAGTSLKVSREDHVHPTDTSRAALASPTFTGTPTLPTGTVATTQASTVANTTVATTAYSKNYTDAGMNSWYCSTFSPLAPTSSAAVTNANDYRWVRVTMAKTGTLHDVYAMIGTTGGNGNIVVLDDGQANATHTTRTVLAVKGSTAVPAAGTWFGFDPALSVAAGDTLVFAYSFDGTTAKVVTYAAGATGTNALPSTSFFPGSGAATTNQKICGLALAANLTASVNSTVTDANMTAALVLPMFVWRIT